jgi:hypothetical protein
VSGVTALGFDPLEYFIGAGPFPIMEHGLEQGIAVLEVPVEAASADTERFGQWLDPYRLRTPTGEKAKTLIDPFAARRAGRGGHRYRYRVRRDLDKAPGMAKYGIHT